MKVTEAILVRNLQKYFKWCGELSKTIKVIYVASYSDKILCNLNYRMII